MTGCCNVQQAEEHSVTELQTKAQPNKAILSKLREEMVKLYTKQVTELLPLLSPSLLLTYYCFVVFCLAWLFSDVVLNVTPCGLRGCKNRAHAVCWLEVVKGIPKLSLFC